MSPDSFELLGALPQRGPLFGLEDRARGIAEAAVISEGSGVARSAAIPK
jgi:hypothetical protein